jgi:DNA-binding beta-propeller fold protein YncE
MSNRAAVSLLLVAILAIVTVAAAAQEAPAESADIRVEGRSVLMFNQHLYFGGLERPRALAYDREHDEIWVADAFTGRIGIFRADGTELYAFSSKQYLRDVSRIALSPRDELAVLEADRTKIRRFSYRGEYLGDVDLPPVEHKRVLSAITYDASGNLYVGDNATAEVFVFNSEGKLKFQFGSHGRDEGQFMAFAAIAVTAEGAIVVADQQALAVQVFDSQGNFVRGWGKHEMGGDNFSLPSGLALDSRGRVYVTDELRHQVKVFTSAGKLLGAFGGLGDGPGQLSFPTDVAIGAQDRVYVAERFTSRVQAFETRDIATDD